MKTQKLITSVSAVLLTLLTITTTAFADEAKAIGKVVAVKQSGWATQMNDSVKKTVKVGDTLSHGDILDVKHGNFVDIALDGDPSNIIHIEGETMMQLFNEGGIRLNVEKGKVFSLLDRLNPSQNFRVATPSAVSTVRGTYFKVETNGTLSQTTAYQGVVNMAGRQPNGKSMRAAVNLTAAQKSRIEEIGKTPSVATKISQAEFEEINNIIKQVGGDRQPLQYNAGSNGATGQGQDKQASQKDLDIKKVKPDDDSNGFDEGKVVF